MPSDLRGLMRGPVGTGVPGKWGLSPPSIGGTSPSPAPKDEMNFLCEVAS
jgi:hypothetical protein